VTANLTRFDTANPPLAVPLEVHILYLLQRNSPWGAQTEARKGTRSMKRLHARTAPHPKPPPLLQQILGHGLCGALQHKACDQCTESKAALP